MAEQASDAELDSRPDAVAERRESPQTADDRGELTQRQELIWLEHALAPDAPTNVMVALFEVDGAIEEERFADAFEALVREVEALRTVIEVDGGVPRARVRGEPPHRPPLVDLSSRSDPRAAMEAWLREHAPRPFALDRRLFDAALLRLGPRRHVVYLRQHHLITDAESHALLWRRLGELYEGRPGMATRAASEYARLERQYRESDAARRDAAFWEPRLSAAPPAPSFYGRAPRSRRGLSTRIEVPLGDGRREAMARLIESSPFAMPSRGLATHLVYATALFSTLYRITGQRRLAVGCPLANRRSKRLRSVVGLVMEQSPMFSEVTDEDTFETLFERLRGELLDVLRHSRHCSHNPSHRKLYDAVLNIHRVQYADFAGHPVRGSIAPGLGYADRWPEGAPDGGEALSLTVFEHGDEEMLAFDLNRDVFDADDRRRVVHHTLRMIDALLGDPSAHPSEVDLLTDAERSICLSPVRIPEALPTVLQEIAAQVERTPEREAVRFEDRSLTYRELWRRVNGVAHMLREAGVRQGEAVAVALERSEQLPAALLGVLGAGAAYVPLDPSHPEERLSRIVEDAAPTALLTDGSLSLPGSRVLRLEDAGVADEPPAIRVGPEDLAYVLFTSGTTGRPKGAQIPHRGLSNFLRAMKHTPGVDADDTVLAIATYAFDIASLELFLPLMVGGRSLVTDRQTATDGRRLCGRIERDGVTVVQATPATFRMLIEAGWEGGEHVTALCGGEPMAPDLAEALLARVGSLWNVYGPTESTVWCTAHRVTRVETPMPVGLPIDHVSVRVLGPRDVPTPVGVEGEICVSGVGVGYGYRNRPELSEALFVDDPLAPGKPMYRSGDRGRWRTDGLLECLGRKDGQIKIRGFRVEIGEIEAVLREHPAVADVAILLRGEGASAHLVAHVAEAGEDAAQVVELTAHARERLPSYMVPSRWRLHDALPVGPTGKVDRKALSEVAVTPRSAAEEEAGPRDDTEAALAALWADVLDLPRVGVTDDFFELGGQSLTAARLVEQVRRTFAVDLPLGALFEDRTVRGLAARVRAGGGVQPDAIIPLQRQGDGVPVYCVCGVQVYHPLATRLGAEHPIYGVYLAQEEEVLREARDGREAQLDVDSMARGYADAIRARQPKGPYVIAGLSFGGLLAYTVAQVLREDGEDVPLVVLFDTVLPRALRRAPLAWLGSHLRAVRRAPRKELQQLVRSLAGGSASHDVQIAGVRERAYVAAMQRYEPRPYDGRVVLFRATESSFGDGTVARRDGGFGDLAPRMRIVEVPGRHVGMMHPPHVQTLAERFRQQLASIDRG